MGFDVGPVRDVLAFYSPFYSTISHTKPGTKTQDWALDSIVKGIPLYGLVGDYGEVEGIGSFDIELVPLRFREGRSHLRSTPLC